MISICLLFVRMLCRFFKPRSRLEAELLILRHQLNVFTPRRRLHLRWVDRALLRNLDAMSIVRPETVVRLHRKGLARYWRWKSRAPARPGAGRGSPKRCAGESANALPPGGYQNGHPPVL